jgi:hypothetical protein
VRFPLLRDFQPFLKDLHLFVFLHDFLLNKRFRDFFSLGFNYEDAIFYKG